MRESLAVLIFFFATNALAADLYHVGIRDFIFTDRVRDRKIQAHIWYPTEPNLEEKVNASSGPFVPVVGIQNAPISKKQKSYPVVLLSHGSMGLANRLFWLAKALVNKGFVVIALDHPGNMFGDSSADGLMRVWDRAKDFSFSFDQALKTPELGQSLDPSRVSAVGYSAGGAAVLLLAGARFALERFSIPTPDCGGSPDPFFRKQCDELKRIDVKKYGKKTIEGDYRDKRVKSVVALDPGFARSFEPSTLKALKARAKVFIAEKLAVPQDEIYSKDFLRLLNAGHTELVPGSVHMSFLAACKEGLTLEDPELKDLCADREKKLRIQTEIAQEVLKFLQ